MTLLELKLKLNTLTANLSKSKLETLVAYASMLKSGKDFWNDLSIEERAGIERGEKDFDEGSYLTINESLEKYKGKFKRKKR